MQKLSSTIELILTALGMTALVPAVIIFRVMTRLIAKVSMLLGEVVSIPTIFFLEAEAWYFKHAGEVLKRLGRRWFRAMRVHVMLKREAEKVFLMFER